MKKRFGFLKDFSFGTIGILWMNVVLTFVIYPYFGNQLGASMHGKILFYLAIFSLLAGSLGSGANYSRLKAHSEEGTSNNGESILFLLLSSVVAIVLLIGVAIWKADTADEPLWSLAILAILMMVRFYGDVNYRISLNYKQFALYYIIIGCGYLVGLAGFLILHSWALVLILGEVAGLIYLFFTGFVLKPPFTPLSKQFKPHFKAFSALSLSYFLSDFVGFSDRLFLPFILTNGDELVAVFYYASVIGKTMSLISTPLNGVISGYLFRDNESISKKKYLSMTGLILGIGVLVTLIAFLGSHLFVRLFYPSYYGQVKDLFLLANAGQVLFFMCNIMMVIILKYAKPSMQIWVNFAYILVYLFVTIPLIQSDGLLGMAWGIFGVNLLKFILFFVFGYISIIKGKNIHGSI